MRKGFIGFIIISILCAGTKVSAQATAKSDTNIIKQHVKILASPSMQGRGTGQKGEKKASAYITKQAKQLKLKPKGDKKFLQPFSFELKLPNPENPHGEMISKGLLKGNNVIAYLDNAAEYTIVIGAHYDHLGLGNLGSSREANPDGKIHHGADDNASGVAGALELARMLQNNGKIEFHNYLFVFFSGEEQGLIGSKYFTNNPSIELDKVNYMINLDMVGRMNPDTKKLVVHGVGTSPEFGETLNKNNASLLSLNFDSSGTGPSDFTSFYLKNIPVLGFFSGQHEDYHKSSDLPELLNYKGQAEIIDFIYRMILDLDDKPKLEFTKTKDKQEGRMKFKVSLGIMPDYTFSGVGLRVDGVSSDKPAEKAGILSGDIIVYLHNREIKTIQDYMSVLGELDKGIKTNVKVKRGEMDLDLEIQF